MATLIFSSCACLGHDTGLVHPETAARLRALLSALGAMEFCYLERREAPPASEAQILRVHRPDYVAALLKRMPDEGLVHLDADTVISPGSAEAAFCAAGAVTAAVDAVMAGEADNAFCAVRPPGHHAEAANAMGFCLFNNIAIGAFQARAVHGLRRIAVVDFDVHHGNGTQAAFAADPDLLYVSLHQWPLYPGTGDPGERGLGNILNLPLVPGSGSAEFRRLAADAALPALDDFAPEMILISAGFDAHRGDPLADLALEDEDYGWITAEICRIARRHAQGRVVSALEGGYNLAALASAGAAHVRALMLG